MSYHTRLAIITSLAVLVFLNASLQAIKASELVPGNPGLIHDTSTMIRVRSGIDRIYNCEFAEAEQTLELLRKAYPEHPLTSFFEGLIYYWRYYPLMPEHPGSAEFELAMKESWERADRLKQQDSSFEGIFFELMSRSFLVMYYADNGKPSHAIVHLATIYRDILKGFEMQEEFRDFLFMTGLYNYYREAYPEAYPVYKPPALFFRKGDREKGLSMLRYAARETDFMKVEASFFLSLINVNFENNPDSALWYASLLHGNYPRNTCFLSKYTEMLLVNRQYDRALEYIEGLMQMDGYNRMQGTVYMGIYEEWNGDPERARRLYEEGLRLAEPYGERANYTRAYAYVGMSRYYMGTGDDGKSRDFYKKAKDSTGYAYVFKLPDAGQGTSK